MKMKVNGLEVDVQYSCHEQADLLKPLLEKLVALREKKKDRLVVYLAAPPGTGKTTLSQYLEYLHKDQAYPFTFQSISIDGFHFKRDYLAEHSILVEGKSVLLQDVKGSPASFDLQALKNSLSLLEQHKSVDWPIYDRKLHDVSFERLSVDADIILVEGNWLLLDEPGWSDLKQLADLTIFIEAKEVVLKPRLIQRKMMGGLSKEDAEGFYKSSDQKNVRRVLEHHSEPDLYWRMQEDGTLEKG